MSQRIRSSAKWQHTFKALTLSNEAIGGPAAKQFHLPDSENPRTVERSFSPDASSADKAKARDLLDYCFVGDGFDLTVDRGDDYYERPRQRLPDEEKQRRREALAQVFAALDL